MRIWADRALYALLVPTFVLLGVFAYYPAISGMYHAFFLWNGSDVSEPVGLDNFKEILGFHMEQVELPQDGTDAGAETGPGETDESGRGLEGPAPATRTVRKLVANDPIFWKSMKNVLILSVFNLLKIIPGVLVAVVLFHVASARARYFYRILIIIPMVVPFMVYLLLWGFIYDPQFGLLNAVLKFLGFGGQTNWLGDPNWVMFSLIFMGFPWVGTMTVLIILAGLEGITQSVFDSAAIDGAGPLRRFFAIELPLVMGQVKLMIILTVINTIKGFAFIWLLTRGGPGYASIVPGVYMMRKGFEQDFTMGYAAAIGIVMFIVILLLTYINNKFIRSGEELPQ